MDTSEQIISTPDKIKNWLLDFVFPPTCVGCKTLISDQWYSTNSHRPGICPACLGKIKFQNHFSCAFCQATVINGLTCPFCRRDYALDQLLVTASYEQSLVKQAIKSFKYQFMAGLGEDLGTLMAVYLKKQLDRDVIQLTNIVVVPVPLSKSRLRWRGFNQAELLAQSIGRTLGLEVNNLLQRHKNSRPQAETESRTDRMINVAGAFSVIPSEATTKNILLIDDLSTTGSTLENCAKALKTAGAKKVTGFVFARN